MAVPNKRLCLSRRGLVRSLVGSAAALASPALAFPALAETQRPPFPQWVETFRARALARGISEATYARVMRPLQPDTTVFAQFRNQPEFGEKIWQYLNRRVSEWRITTGMEKAKEYAPLLGRIEQDFGVERSVIL